MIGVIVAGVSFAGWMSARTFRQHNDVYINKKKPYRFRTHGQHKFIDNATWTRPDIKFNEQTGKWEKATV